jgi:acetyl/propionyl-CoA carboxylase alpha subunit
LPSPGRIGWVVEPAGPGIRVDSGITSGYEVPAHYDPMLAKLSVWAMDREGARRRMITALRDYVVLGLTTNVPFLIDVLNHREFAAGRLHTHFLDDHLHDWTGSNEHEDLAALAAALHSVLAPVAAISPTGRPAASPSPWLSLGSWRVGAPG